MCFRKKLVFIQYTALAHAWLQKREGPIEVKLRDYFSAMT